MDSNNYLGSFAQENVQFQTAVVEDSTYGENFQRVMIFADYNLIADTTALLAVEGSTTLKVATVTVNSFASITKGILQSWLTDLYANGELEEAYVVVDTSGAMTAVLQETAYSLLKPHAYWKTVCVCQQADSAADPAITEDTAKLDDDRFNTLAAALADLCLVDKQVLSSPVLAPWYAADPTQYETDARYTALKGKFVYMSYHPDSTRNAALYSIGLALSTNNSSGTPVGNSVDMVKSNSITSSNLPEATRKLLTSLNIQTFKPIGDNSANVAAEGEDCLNGDKVPAVWLVAYITYMSKVQIAGLITEMNFYKNETNYGRILTILENNISLFAGRLSSIYITAPAYSALPSSSARKLVIPDAWQATLVLTIGEVQISGTLYIGE